MHFYDRESKKWFEKDKKSDAFDWSYKHSPHGMVKWTPRKNSIKWLYVYFGETKEEVMLKANEFYQERIDYLEKEIQEIRKNLITID